MTAPGGQPTHTEASGSFQFELSLPDYLAANWLFLRLRWLWKGIMRVGGALALFYALLFAVPEIMDSATVDPIRLATNIACGVFAAAIVLIAGMLALLWRIPRSARKSYRELKMEGVSSAVTFSSASFEMQNRFGTSTHEWSDFIGWCENERIVLLLRTSQMYYAIPAAQVPLGTMAALRFALAAGGVKRR